MRRRWEEILLTAADIVQSYNTGVTLRQLFYRLVSQELLNNTKSEYTQLSDKTAIARRAGTFPSFIDRTRKIYETTTFEGPHSAQEWLANIYRRDRTEGQEYTVYLGVEKEGIVEQLRSWFGAYGVPIIALRGYASQTYVDEVKEHSEQQGRPAVLIYSGDFDPSGEDIERDFVKRSDCFTQVYRVALTREQVLDYDLPPQMGKAADSRAGAFIEKYGELVQVELDALPPDILKGMYEREFKRFFDLSTYEGVMNVENEERELLRSVGNL